MKFSFCVLVVFFCASSFAQTFKNEEAVSVILREKKCLAGKERVSATIKVDREEKSGDNFIGVTSKGDVAFLEDNNILHLYLCQTEKNISKGGVFKEISTVNDPSACSVGEIIALNVLLDDSIYLPFRSIRYDETSLCHGIKGTKINESRENVLKEENSLLQKDGFRANANQQ